MNKVTKWLNLLNLLHFTPDKTNKKNIIYIILKKQNLNSNNKKKLRRQSSAHIFGFYVIKVFCEYTLTL